MATAVAVVVVAAAAAAAAVDAPRKTLAATAKVGDTENNLPKKTEWQQ